MNILLLYPQYPDTFWSFKHALKFISKRAVNPPLGLITVSSMLPGSWSKKLVDLNVESLNTKDIEWADLIFISAMSVQTKSAQEIITRCKSLNKKIVAGGPLFTEEPDRFPEVDYFVLNEAEITLPPFINNLIHGDPKRIYQTKEFADIKSTPLPDYSLIKMSKYSTLNIQYSRGCPFNCEFCDITALFGHKVRTKSTRQIINELESIYQTGWRKNIFFVDDNFIGNKKILKTELLPAMIKWMESRKYPFIFSTEASINLSDDEELMDLMTRAGFSDVFIGIETTEEDSLLECGKVQNVNRNLVHSVWKIQKHGLGVSGGFILGFDNDSLSVFQKQIDFIKDSGIITAMVGLLNVPRKTRLYQRLVKEGRIINEFSGNNTDFTLNFIPKMDKKYLLEGYKTVIKGIYGGKEYYQRVLDFVKRFTPNQRHKGRVSLKLIIAFIRSSFKLGLLDKYRVEYWKLFFWTLFNRPKMFPLAITYSVYGYHFRRVFKEVI
ncbi:MAG: B12-binding domain-containing radical SAM protein [Bacteroidetes bacterium]|nr:MAG: B12-binding domain-containing radical SAM protein [Bacteroidota bacterium]RLD71933.1 MAG: B12-binding domain-containing radical SAM protein [Bacteroidota bacterium]RLD88105.1 MAG: B12-binding domain-containing radical SAM protein [Bacteroidota bacterium]